MWSLPSIIKINEDAAKNENKYVRAVKTLVLNRKRVRCDRCEAPASHAEIWYDIFGPDPKGIMAACEACCENYGLEGDACFHCADCERTFVTNYSWELYLKHTDDGETLCLNCYRAMVATLVLTVIILVPLAAWMQIREHAD